MIRCPLCGGRSIGKIGAGQYYCSECCREFSVSKHGVRAFEVDAEGELTQIQEARLALREGDRP